MTATYDIIMEVKLFLCAAYSFLIKRLEQFEVLDEVPASRMTLYQDSCQVEDEKALLVAAIRIQGQLDAELARLKAHAPSDHDSKRLHPPPSHTSGTTSPVSSHTHNPAPSHSRVTTTPLQSPIASVIVTPSSLVPASVPPATKPTVSTKKKTTKGRGGLGERQKATGHRGGGTAKRKRPDADPNAPKKPSNAFFWFCQEKRAPLQEQFRGEGMSGQHDLTKALARLWSETASEEKKVSVVCVIMLKDVRMCM